MTNPLVSTNEGSDDSCEISNRFTDSMDLLHDSEALRQRAQEDGYLFFKGLLPRQEILDLRKDFLSVVDRYGWRKPGQDALGGEMDLDLLNMVPDEQIRSDIGVSEAAYKDVQKLESFHRFPHHDRLKALYKELFQDEVLVHPRHIARMVTGHRVMVPTPPHQDFPAIQGSTNTWTAWIPLGDCPRSMGGLSVLRSSDRLGYVPITLSKGAGGVAAQTCPWETDWAETDFEAGDVLTFPSLTIHKALRCQHRQFIRLSMDIRYQPKSEPVEIKSLYPHADIEWDDIYSNWVDDDLKYYWEKDSLTLDEWNPNLLQPSRRIC